MNFSIPRVAVVMNELPNALNADVVQTEQNHGIQVEVLSGPTQVAIEAAIVQWRAAHPGRVILATLWQNSSLRVNDHNINNKVSSILLYR